MKSMLTLLILTFSLNSYAFITKECNQLKSKDLAEVCSLMTKDCYSTITESWEYAMRAGEIENTSLDDHQSIITEMFNFDEYQTVKFNTMPITNENAGLTLSWIFEKNENSLYTLTEKLKKSSLEAYALFGTVIYMYDSGFLFVDKDTNEVFMIGSGDS